jgi:hypothetical protein
MNRTTFPAAVTLVLGHKDGGAFAAQTYGHIIASHSEKQITKVAI